MRDMKTWVSVLLLSAGVLVATGFSKPAKPAVPANMEGVARYIALLKSGTAQQKAEAAYKIGQQRSSAAEAVPSLIDPCAEKFSFG